MKTVFVINPAAGKGIQENLPKRIYEAADACGAEAEVYFTKSAGDAARFVKNYLENYGAARFIAVGGDGTLNEVLNGMMGAEKAEIGVLPSGSGNDFCRNFPCNFQDITSQLTAACEAVDVISAMREGGEKTYILNMCNIGFDCNVAHEATVIRKKGIIRGSAAYFAAILSMLIRKKGANLRIEADGEILHEGPLLLTSIANGSFCGGGIKSNPLASVQDGKININIIKDVPRRMFLQLLPAYMHGTVFEKRIAKGIISTMHCRKVRITPKEADTRLCIDGEIINAGETVFEIVPTAVRFVLPGFKAETKREKEALPV